MTELQPEKPTGSPETIFSHAAKADFIERLIAKFIDLLVVGLLFSLPTFVGVLAGATYILIADGIGGQSLGKRIIGLKATSSASGAPCDFKGSIARNMVFGVLILWYVIVGWIPYIGTVLVFLASAAVLGIEVMLIYSDTKGARFGDRIAGTVVVAIKELSRANIA